MHWHSEREHADDVGIQVIFVDFLILSSPFPSLSLSIPSCLSFSLQLDSFTFERGKL